MKRVTNTALPVKINYDLNEIKNIKFVFTQGYRRQLFEYPSEHAIRKNEDENIIILYWSLQQTAMFSADTVKMDTFITLKDSDQNPETPIVTFKMNPSLFSTAEVEE